MLLYIPGVKFNYLLRIVAQYTSALSRSNQYYLLSFYYTIYFKRIVIRYNTHPDIGITTKIP